MTGEEKWATEVLLDLNRLRRKAAQAVELEKPEAAKDISNAIALVMPHIQVVLGRRKL